MATSEPYHTHDPATVRLVEDACLLAYLQGVRSRIGDWNPFSSVYQCTGPVTEFILRKC